MTNMLRERLKNARESAGLTLQQLSERTQIGPSSISEYESGKREPSVAQLQALATALCRSITFFLSPDPIPTEEVFWRKKPSAPQAQELGSRFRRLCEQYHNLEIWSGNQTLPDLPLEECGAQRFTYDQAEVLARKMLHGLQLGGRPALTLLSALEERCNVKIFHLDFEPTGSAACTLSSTFGAAVLLNAKNVRWRRNFDLAHELFHLLTWRVFRSQQAGSSGDEEQVEKFATCFARHLLMPAEEVKGVIAEITRNRLLSYDDLFDIARQFDVSMEALLWQMHFLYSREKKDTEKDIACCKARFDFLEGRSNDAPPLRPKRFEALALRALRSGGISLGRFAEYMGIGRRQAAQFVQQESFDEQEVQIPTP